MADRLLKPKEISCRVQQINEKGLTLLLYVTSRAGQNLLDEKYGPLGWQDSYRLIDGDLFCSISAWSVENKMWVSKEDVGTASYTAKEKGRASDAFKRACVKHDIARELYSAPFIWVPASQCNVREKDERYYTNDKFFVNDITYTASGEIDSIEIINQNMDIVFKTYPCGKITKEHYQALLVLIKKADVDTQEILDICKIKDLQDMDMSKYVSICNKLNKTLESKGLV